jgi:CelD/BcsL family acetyltransferase involved in cellulose biosynthesis
VAVGDAHGVEEGWSALAERTQAPPALHPGYLLRWASAHQAEGRVRVVTVHDDGELRAILPFVMTRSRLATLPMRGVEEVGMVADGPDAAREAARAVVRLRVARLLLRPVAADGLTDVSLGEAVGELGGTLLRRRVDEYPYVDVTTDWTSYWSGLSRNTRSDVSRRRRRLAELGDVEVDVLDGSHGLEAAIDSLLRIEQSGWKGRSGTAIAATPAEERFYRSLAGWAATKGWLRLSFLRLDGRPIAFHYSLQACGVIYALKIGYDEELAAHSPGKVLMAAEIERAFREGCRRFDFSGSSADYKTRWATGSRKLLELSTSPPTALGRLGAQIGRARLRAAPIAKGMRTRLLRRENPRGDRQEPPKGR